MILLAYNWLKKASGILTQYTDTNEFPSLWSDFIDWSCYQAGDSDIAEAEQGRITKKYPDSVKRDFLRLYHVIESAIAIDPNQNVLLKIMVSMGMEQHDNYNEVEKNCSLPHLSVHSSTLDQSVNDVETESDSGYLAYIDENCAASKGSWLIAYANKYRENCPFDFQSGILLAAADHSAILFAKISFIQMAIMGMSCFVLMDSTYAVSSIPGMELFAPPTAVCSSGYFRETWTKRRLEVMIAAREGSL